MQPSIHELAHQAEWEMEGTRRAVERYREAELVADPMSLAPGKALVRGVVGPLIAALIVKRDEAADALASAGGRPPLYAWSIQVVDLEKAAVIALNVAVRTLSGEHDHNGMKTASITSSAKVIAGALRDQLEYDRWVVAEEQRNAEAKRAKVEKHEDRLKALKLRYPNMDRRVWKKWAAKLELAAAADWNEEDAIQLGTMVLHLLCEVAPDRFTKSEKPTNGGVQYVLGVTEEVRQVMNDVRERAEVARPLLMPMLCPPLPWKYEEPA